MKQSVRKDQRLICPQVQSLGSQWRCNSAGYYLLLDASVYLDGVERDLAAWLSGHGDFTVREVFSSRGAEGCVLLPSALRCLTRWHHRERAPGDSILSPLLLFDCWNFQRRTPRCRCKNHVDFSVQWLSRSDSPSAVIAAARFSSGWSPSEESPQRANR